ncbi:sensor histidine kinase [Anaerocolumna sp. MB42-C2]|uniref:sensor histidine kinase n=1 Tax=Anaerocolumna sp. MB42-C2 TaxID=3070997 RepID=UPI0027E0FA87|nr:sensor histidine kinase [Anaerocolumna sp. MB42-C2]WMJ86514.1 sensor histidine kinase [Anaerocolumna sp. MB42-C2]
MIITLLSLIIIVLFVLFLRFYWKYKSQTSQLIKLKTSLSDIMEYKSNNKILLYTEEKAVRQLLVEINHLQEQKTAAEVKLNEQEESSKKMLANISHDLKTPLTVILGYSELLRNTQDIRGEAREKILKIEKNAKDVLEVIDIFFDLMKLESGDFPLKNEIVDLSELCREEIINYYDVLQAEGFQVIPDIPERQVLVLADISALKRILANLIQNVIRYGAEGKYLKLSVYEESNECFIEVMDKGKGIIEDKQDKIFERLFTLEDSRNKKYQGSGLGLTITKRLIESMNGTIKLRSKPYEETVFTVGLKKLN